MTHAERALLLLVSDHARFPRHVYPRVAALAALVLEETPLPPGWTQIDEAHPVYCRCDDCACSDRPTLDTGDIRLKE